MKRWAAEHRLSIFFLLSIGWTWIVGLIPVSLGIAGTDTGNLIFMLTAGPAPSIVGLILVFTTYRKAARRDFFRRFIPTWRGAWFVALYTALLLGVCIVSVTMFTGDSPDFDTLRAFAAQPLSLLSFVFFMYLWGPANEEFGWRGYALDPLMMRFGFLGGNLVLGVLWGVWHMPWIFYAAQWQHQSFQLSPLWFVAFVVATIATSFVMAIAYVLSGRNLFTATTVHALSNTTLALAYANPSLAAQNAALLGDIALSFTLTAVIWWGFRGPFRRRFEAEMRAVISVSRD